MTTYMILALYEQKPQIDVIQCFISKTEEEAQETFVKFLAKASNLYPNVLMFQLNKQEMIAKNYPAEICRTNYNAMDIPTNGSAN